MQRDILLSWFYPHPPESVWACLTDPELISQWLMENNFKPVVGHQFEFRSKPIPAFKWDGIVYCEVLEIVEFSRIKFTWQSGSERGKIDLDTTVTWILEPKDNGTRLRLEHKGFTGMKYYLASLMMEKGWKKIGSVRMLRSLQNLVK